MTSISPEQLVHEIHALHRRFVIATTGGGSGAISVLLGVPGASRSILSATVPYAAEALTEWLGGKPDEFCSPGTARAMAMAAFLKARQYDPRADACGVACTASLATDRPKRGEHRLHLAYQTADTTAEVSLRLEKGKRSRSEEETIATALLLNLAAEASGAQARLSLSLLASEQLVARRVVAPGNQQALLAGRVQAISPSGHEQPRPLALFPGAFHPLHAGHQKIVEIARQLLGRDVAFEISILNVDKPPLDFIEIEQRVRQFAPQQAVWLTRAPYFTQKAALFPGATFVVGADTVARIGQARYYGGQESAMLAAVDAIGGAGCRFLVFGRLVEGAFRSLADLQLPESLARLCREVPESEFRLDLSATQLRRQAQSDE